MIVWCKNANICMYHSLRNGCYECANGGTLDGYKACDFAVFDKDVALQRTGRTCPDCEGQTVRFDYIMGHDVICGRCNGVGKIVIDQAEAQNGES